MHIHTTQEIHSPSSLLSPSPIPTRPQCRNILLLQQSRIQIHFARRMSELPSYKTSYARICDTTSSPPTTSLAGTLLRKVSDHHLTEAETCELTGSSCYSQWNTLLHSLPAHRNGVPGAATCGVCRADRVAVPTSRRPTLLSDPSILCARAYTMAAV